MTTKPQEKDDEEFTASNYLKKSVSEKMKKIFDSLNLHFKNKKDKNT